MNLNPVAGIVDSVGSIISTVYTSDKERLQAELEFQKQDNSLLLGQMEVNKVEASNNSTWRPFIGKVGGYALAYHFIAYPVLIWIWGLLQAGGVIGLAYTPPPPMDVEPLWALITGMLGLGTARTFEKLKGKS